MIKIYKEYSFEGFKESVKNNKNNFSTLEIIEYYNLWDVIFDYYTNANLFFKEDQIIVDLNNWAFVASFIEEVHFEEDFEEEDFYDFFKKDFEEDFEEEDAESNVVIEELEDDIYMTFTAECPHCGRIIDSYYDSTTRPTHIKACNNCKNHIEWPEWS